MWAGEQETLDDEASDTVSTEGAGEKKVREIVELTVNIGAIQEVEKTGSSSTTVQATTQKIATMFSSFASVGWGKKKAVGVDAQTQYAT
eukprot:1183946-Prorocentrum_minimum.AAC.2